MSYFNSLSNLGSDPSNIKKIVETPKGVDENVWQYEHIR